ncbi:hypothetical protein [Pseudoxanthomonas sp.]|jgi:hypothetical protein|uniref:hypothetical protein n=1 Tax=Pseudoxanthomonas sp. TaxID=1871049 RepID=UPI002E0DB664|nr:hypothetical protein [Pseudoxanthomonas sp.]
MQKKVDLSSYRGYLVEVVLQRADDSQPWSPAVRVRRTAGGGWSEDLWLADARDYFTCYDALAACKAQAQRAIDAQRQTGTG